MNGQSPRRTLVARSRSIAFAIPRPARAVSIFASCFQVIAAYHGCEAYEGYVTRRDLVHAISPGRTGSDKSKWDSDEPSHPKAEGVVSAVFDSIAEALKKGEKVTL